MGFFDRLLGRRPLNKSPLRDVSTLLGPMHLPAVHLVQCATRSRSHFGGVPNLPPGLAWPQRRGSRLSFLARLSLADLQAVQVIDWLPATGALLFFYDMNEQPWGYDPKDRGGAVVMHVPDLDSPPVAADCDDVGVVGLVPHRDLQFRCVRTYPPSDRSEVSALHLTEEELDAVSELEGAEFQGRPRHQVGGYPSPVQGSDMDLECQLVTHGLYCGNASGYKDPRAAALRDGASDWRLLLQFDSDDDLGVMWGDAGTIYFWVQQEGARRGDFSNAWLILQCT